MADKLVTLGTFDSPVEARFAVNRLEEAGIPALVADKNTVAMDFLLGNAVGCIKVQVQAADLERAEAVLADPTDRVPEDETPWDDADQSGAADAGERADVKRTIADQRAAPAAADAPPDRGERLVTVAYRPPVFGAIFVPRNVVSLVYVLVVTFGVNDLSPAATRRFFLALLVDLGLPAFWGCSSAPATVPTSSSSDRPGRLCLRLLHVRVYPRGSRGRTATDQATGGEPVVRARGRTGGPSDMHSTPLVRHILRDEAVTRGLGDVEARMLIDWLTDRAERIAAEVPTEAAGWAAVRAMCRRARAVACFVRLWSDPRSRGPATQLAAAERMPWPLPRGDADPGEVMSAILAWSDRRDEQTADVLASRAA